MFQMNARVFLAATALLTLFPFVASGAAGPSERVVISTKEAYELTKSQPPSKVLMTGDHLLVPHTGSKILKAVPVVLQATKYNVVSHRTADDGTENQSVGSRYFWELTSPKEVIGYSWGMWSDSHPAGFRLFSDGNGHNYLAWSESVIVYFEEVSTPKSRGQALREHISHTPGKRYGVAVTELVGRAPFNSGSAIDMGINIESAGVDAQGRPFVSVTGTKRDRVYRIIGENGKWQLQ